MEAPDVPTLLRLVKAAICHLYVLVVAGQSLEVSGTITGPPIYVAPLESRSRVHPEVRPSIHPTADLPPTHNSPSPGTRCCSCACPITHA